MMVDDDILTLYYYRDGLSDAERQRVRAALEHDASLRARYDELRADLARFDAPPVVAAPDDMKARWRDGVDRAARLERQAAQPVARTFHLPSFAWGSAVAATLVVGFGLYLAREPAPEPVPDASVADATTAPERLPSLAFERGLQVHLRDTRRELAGLPTDVGEERVMLIMRMVQQNRSYERAATQNGARVLRALEPVLIELAAEDIPPAQAQALQDRLAFELKVTLTRLERAVSEDAGTPQLHGETT
jgi:hypothetical protein